MVVLPTVWDLPFRVRTACLGAALWLGDQIPSDRSWTSTHLLTVMRLLGINRGPRRRPVDLLVYIVRCSEFQTELRPLPESPETFELSTEFVDSYPKKDAGYPRIGARLYMIISPEGLLQITSILYDGTRYTLWNIPDTMCCSIFLGLHLYLTVGIQYPMHRSTVHTAIVSERTLDPDHEIRQLLFGTETHIPSRFARDVLVYGLRGGVFHSFYPLSYEGLESLMVATEERWIERKSPPILAYQTWINTLQTILRAYLARTYPDETSLRCDVALTKWYRQMTHTTEALTRTTLLSVVLLVCLSQVRRTSSADLTKSYLQVCPSASHSRWSLYHCLWSGAFVSSSIPLLESMPEAAYPEHLESLYHELTQSFHHVVAHNC